MQSSAGPFLRYGNCLPGQSTWHGSALFLTRSAESEALYPTKTADRNSTIPISARSESLVQPPVLVLEDPGPFPSKNAAEAATQQQLEPELLDTVLGWSFWRFNITLELGNAQRAVKYAIIVPGAGNSDTAFHTFFLPPIGQPYHWGYFSCNGLSLDVPEDTHYARKDPTYLWKDLLQLHSTFPIHVLVGGGDQVYSDAVWQESQALKEWSNLENFSDKLASPWTPTHESEAISYYLNNYIANFTQPHVSTAYASIASVHILDDHDIFDGFNSYDDDLQACPIFQNLIRVGLRFYLLFQQHTTAAREAQAHEFMHNAARDGYHSMRFMGPQVALMVIDMRSKRTKHQILPLSTYQLLRNAAMELPECVEHLVVMSAVPLIFPSIPFSETILRGVKSLFAKFAFCRSIGEATGVMDRFGQPEILDDITDGWAANVHKGERHMFIQLLQEIALVKNVRVSILSGDAHVAGVGRLYGRPKCDPHDDPLFMPQIISSAIMNAPPPLQVVRMLMRTNFATNVDHKTRQKMVRAFWPRHPRTDKLLARRNWCDVTMVAPPYAAPGNPSDPEFGGLRFSLRVENPELWYGYAEEVYEVVAPRAPAIAVGPHGHRYRRHLHWHHHAVTRYDGGAHADAGERTHGGVEVARV